MNDMNVEKPWYELGLGLRQRAAPIYRTLRHLPTDLGIRAYLNWIDHHRRKNMQQTLDSFERIVATLNKDSIALDCGANRGDFTERLAKTGAQVHSFEPEPLLFAALEKRFANTPNVKIYNTAVASRSGMVSLYLEKSTSQDPLARQSHSIVEGGMLTKGGEYLSVMCIDIFEFVSKLDRKPDITKMDIEGAEVEILERMISEGRMEDFGQMFVETHERQIPELGERIVIVFRKILSGKIKNVNMLWP